MSSKIIFYKNWNISYNLKGKLGVGVESQRIKIGIPRSLLFYKYDVLWRSFFEYLGCELVVSPKTNKAILEKGLGLSVDENCLPIKVFLGHVDELKDKVDYILIPRFASYCKDESTCTKFNATVDIVSNTFDDLRILDYNVDVDKGHSEKKGFLKMGEKLGFNPLKVRRAYKLAKQAQNTEDEKKHKEQEELLKKKGEHLKILVVSHPYNIYDELIGQPILKLLKTENVEPIMADLFDKEEAVLLSEKMSKRLYWTANKELLGGLEYYKKYVDGIIFIVTFPCGPDSLVTELCIRKIKDLPMMTLVLDELQGEAGLKTRIESFVDIIKMKKKKAVYPIK